MPDEIENRLQVIRQKIEKAKHRANREKDIVRLIGICKNQPIEKIRLVQKLGLQDLGHNYVQGLQIQERELEQQFFQSKWHFVGSLQRKKVRQLLSLFLKRNAPLPMIHSLDREFLAMELHNQMQILQPNSLPGCLSCLIQVLPQASAKEETMRTGCPAEQIPQLLEKLASLPNLSLKGLMILPPLAKDPQESRKHFRFLKSLGQDLQGNLKRLGCERLTIQEYSMGMSEDFEVAIEEGATLLRVGTALFGGRQNRRPL